MEQGRLFTTSGHQHYPHQPQHDPRRSLPLPLPQLELELTDCGAAFAVKGEQFMTSDGGASFGGSHVPTFVLTNPEDDAHLVPCSPRIGGGDEAAIARLFTNSSSASGAGDTEEDILSASLSVDNMSELESYMSSAPASPATWTTHTLICGGGDGDGDLAQLPSADGQTAAVHRSSVGSVDSSHNGCGEDDSIRVTGPALEDLAIPEHVLHMNNRDLKKYLRTQSGLSEAQKAYVKKQRRRLMNRVYAKRARDKKALEEVTGGGMCPAQMQAKITRLQAEVDDLRAVQEQLVRIMNARCPDALAVVSLCV